ENGARPRLNVRSTILTDRKPPLRQRTTVPLRPTLGYRPSPGYVLGFAFLVSRWGKSFTTAATHNSKRETRNSKRHLKIGQTMPPVSHCHRNVGQIITEHGIQSTEMPAPNQLPPVPATSFCTEDKTSMAPAGFGGASARSAALKLALYSS